MTAAVIPSETVRHASVQCLSPAGWHRMAYREWGDPDNQNVVLCLHGVTRLGADFDTLAQVLAKDFRVVCPDIVGRGASEWLRDGQHYHIFQYAADVVTLLARVSGTSLSLVGTSMGGLIGMLLAGKPGTPIQRLVINDIGPAIETEALERIGTYIGETSVFASFEEGLAFVRQACASFGPHNDQQWCKLAADSLRQNPDGSWRRHYDPAVAAPFMATTPASIAAGESLLWAAYDAIECPTLLLRGQDSDLLSAGTALAMTQRGPHAQLVSLPDIGHAPSLVALSQIQLIENFLHGKGP